MTQLLPELWRSPLEVSFFLARHAPVLHDGAVTARAGAELVQVGAADGAARWRLRPQARGGNGSFLRGWHDLLLTDVVRRDQGWSSLIGVSAAGEVVWRRDLTGVLAPLGSLLVGDRLHVLTGEPGQGEVLHVLAADTGDELTRGSMPWGADEFVDWNGRLLVCNHLTERGSPGLYVVDADGGGGEAISPASTWRVLRLAGIVLTVTREPDGAAWIRAADEGSLAELWSAPVAGDAVAMTGDLVLSVEADDDGGRHLVARQTGTGQERWRSARLTGEVGTIEATGRVVLCHHASSATLLRQEDGAVIGKTEEPWSPPAAAAGRIYLLDGDSLTCLEEPGPG